MKINTSDLFIKQSLDPKYFILDESEICRLEEKVQKLFGIARVLDKNLQRDFDFILNRRGIFNADKATEIHVLNRELAPFCDGISACFPDVGLGYYSKSLDAILVYSPSNSLGYTVGMALPENHIGETVMTSRRERMCIGSMVRGDVLSCFHPISRKGKIIGYCWANETIESIYKSSINRDRERVFRTDMEPLLGLMGLLLFETRSFALLHNRNKSPQNIIQYIEYFLNNFSLGIIILNEKREALYISSGAEKLLRISARRWMGKDFNRYFQAHFSHDLSKLIEENEQHCVFISDAQGIRHGDIDLNFFLSTMNVDGSLFHFLFFEDRRKANLDREKEKRSQELSMLGSLSASLAHEIRNPLTIIDGLAKLIPEKMEINDRAFFTRFSEIIDTEIRKVDALVETLLNLSRSAKQDQVQTDLNAAAKASVDLFRHMMAKKNVILIEEYQDGLPVVKGCVQDLEKALINLILNSLQAMPDGGFLKVTTEHKPSSGFVSLAIKDTGNAIPEEDRQRLFTPFFTTKEKGTGLGLALVYKIIQDHKGYIECSSKRNKGTCFTISLPTLEFVEILEKTDEFKKTHTCH